MKREVNIKVEYDEKGFIDGIEIDYFDPNHPDTTNGNIMRILTVAQMAMLKYLSTDKKTAIGLHEYHMDKAYDIELNTRVNGLHKHDLLGECEECDGTRAVVKNLGALGVQILACPTCMPKKEKGKRNEKN